MPAQLPLVSMSFLGKLLSTWQGGSALIPHKTEQTSLLCNGIRQQSRKTGSRNLQERKAKLDSTFRRLEEAEGPGLYERGRSRKH